MEGVIVKLFQAECDFLDKVCKNMMHDFHLKNALIGIFAITVQKGQLVCENIYQRNLTENPEGVDMEEYLEYVRMLSGVLVEPEKVKLRLAEFRGMIEAHCMHATHALCALRPETGVQGIICIDVCVYEKNKAGVSDFAVAFAEALCRFRRRPYDIYGLKVGKVASFMKPAVGLVTMAVQRWLSDDENFQFWLKTYEPYDRGYFEEPDLSGMGKAMLCEMQDGIRNAATEVKRNGTLKLQVYLYEEQMKKAFNMDKDSFWGEITMCFALGEKQKTPIVGSTEFAVKCMLHLTNEQDEQFCAMEVLAKVSTDGVPSELERTGYMVELTKVLAKYAEVWRIVAKPKNYKLIVGQC